MEKFDGLDENFLSISESYGKDSAPEIQFIDEENCSNNGTLDVSETFDGASPAAREPARSTRLDTMPPGMLKKEL